jgi:hypothetical protein
LASTYLIYILLKSIWTETIEDEIGIKPSDPPRPISWLKILTERHQIETAYVGYGDEADLKYAYGEICLIFGSSSL